jgi:hypothetical protein
MASIPRVDQSKVALPTRPNVPFVNNRPIDGFEIGPALAKSPAQRALCYSVATGRDALADTRDRFVNRFQAQVYQGDQISELSPSSNLLRVCQIGQRGLNGKIRADFNKLVNAAEHQPCRENIRSNLRVLAAQAARDLVRIDELKAPFVRSQLFPREGRLAGAVGTGNDDQRWHIQSALFASFAAAALST